MQLEDRLKPANCTPPILDAQYARFNLEANKAKSKLTGLKGGEDEFKRVSRHERKPPPLTRRATAVPLHRIELERSGIAVARVFRPGIYVYRGCYAVDRGKGKNTDNSAVTRGRYSQCSPISQREATTILSPELCR
jgi:hypothetical protein